MRREESPRIPNFRAANSFQRMGAEQVQGPPLRWGNPTSRLFWFGVIKSEAFLKRLPKPALATPVPVAAEGLVRKADGRPLRVGDLCVTCEVPRRTLNHAFQEVLGMGAGGHRSA